MDEIKRRLDLLCEAMEWVGEMGHVLADLAAHPRLPDEQRRALADEVHRLADKIEEVD